jgi:hypothetical protein
VEVHNVFDNPINWLCHPDYTEIMIWEARGSYKTQQNILRSEIRGEFIDVSSADENE